MDDPFRRMLTTSMAILYAAITLTTLSLCGQTLILSPNNDPTAAKTIPPLIKIDRMQKEFNFRPACVLDDLSNLIDSYKAQFATIE